MLGKSGLVKQVVIASLPGAVPEVHVATLSGSELSLREAEVHSGEVSMGSEAKVNLEGASIASSGNGEVVVLKSGKRLVALHFEAEEEEQSWLQLLKDASQSSPKADASKPKERQRFSGKRPNSPGTSAPASPAGRAAPGPLKASQPAPKSGDDVARLQARSRQLQDQIEELEAVGARRDKQLQRLMKRLDGSIEMLQAVQDMCNQQRKVIYAQRVAIVELRRECGETVDFDAEAKEASPEASRAQPDATALGTGQAQGSTDDDGEGEVEDLGSGDLEARTRQLMSLLAQAEHMQGALQALHAEDNAEGLSDLEGLSSELAQLTAMMGLGAAVESASPSLLPSSADSPERR